MKLYIQVENGVPVNHPALEENLFQSLGYIPDNWEPFVRVPNPTSANDTLVLERPDPIYQKVDGVWTDVWLTRTKTEAEIAAEKEKQIQDIKDAWSQRPYAHNFTAWVLNEEKGQYAPPIPRPTDGKFYRWSGPNNNWREAEPFPQDGKKYTFDFDNWVNVEIA
jgi:hypothetical protein